MFESKSVNELVILSPAFRVRAHFSEPPYNSSPRRSSGFSELMGQTQLATLSDSAISPGRLANSASNSFGKVRGLAVIPDGPNRRTRDGAKRCPGASSGN